MQGSDGRGGESRHRGRNGAPERLPPTAHSFLAGAETAPPAIRARSLAHRIWRRTGIDLAIRTRATPHSGRMTATSTHRRRRQCRPRRRVVPIFPRRRSMLSFPPSRACRGAWPLKPPLRRAPDLYDDFERSVSLPRRSRAYGARPPRRLVRSASAANALSASRQSVRLRTIEMPPSRPIACRFPRRRVISIDLDALDRRSRRAVAPLAGLP